MRTAISFCFGDSCAGRASNQPRASRTDRAVTALMSCIATFTARASGLRRLPPQVWHGVSAMKREMSSRDHSLSVSL